MIYSDVTREDSTNLLYKKDTNWFVRFWKRKEGKGER
jgi:hypothetical protein